MCSKSDTKKVEKIQERELCFTYRKFESDYQSLLNLTGHSFLYMGQAKNYCYWSIWGYKWYVTRKCTRFVCYKGKCTWLKGQQQNEVL